MYLSRKITHKLIKIKVPKEKISRFFELVGLHLSARIARYFARYLEIVLRTLWMVKNIYFYEGNHSEEFMGFRDTRERKLTPKESNLIQDFNQFIKHH